MNATPKTSAPTANVADEMCDRLWSGLFTREQAARALGLSRFQIDQLIKSGELPVSRIGKTPYIGKATLDAYIARLLGEQVNGSAPTE